MRTEVFQTANNVISALTDLAKNRNLVFRGYSKQPELYPNIIREKDLRNREIELLADFEKYGLQYFSVNNAIDFMSYAQHFGLPTRLLILPIILLLHFSLLYICKKGLNTTMQKIKNTTTFAIATLLSKSFSILYQQS